MVVNICIIMFYLLFGIEMTMLFCFLPVIWFNNTYIDCSCNQFHCKVSVPLYDCVITRYLEWSFLDIYIYICIKEEGTSLCTPIFFYFFGEKRPRHEKSSLLLIFVSGPIWKWHGFIMYSVYCIEESYTSHWKLYYIIFYVNTNNRIVIFLIVCLWPKRGMEMSRISLITLCYSQFIWTFIYFDKATPFKESSIILFLCKYKQ